ncbi:hypothetical protein PIIN_06161 [Serendipita indica DSM 11827]|uniref:F-box domain-containing protein n=1 Tax=Serendipita indica (strain DSM 11827) TaxID=1109443 RepID=G4TLN4_SERID|nr:hypothetical protein PIIN_06161 [Serendipita indica DSM 11827]
MPRHVDLPVELWEQILENAIHVPVFLDSNPITIQTAPKYPRLFNERAYWESERVRNALRRVCASWNAFLSAFDHRYIHMADVIHGIVPVQALQRAIRIRFEDVPISEKRVRREISLLVERSDLGIFENGRALPWRLEIMETTSDFAMSARIILPSNRHINIKSITGSSDDTLLFLITKGVEVAPGLLWTTQRQLFTWGATPNKHFRNVITLAFTTASHADIALPDFPALRHLYVTALVVPDLNRAPAWLKAFGKQLHVLYWLTRFTSGPKIVLNSTIWDLCPLVEVLSIPPRVAWTPPPKGHPIHTIVDTPSFTKCPGLVCHQCSSHHDIITIPSISFASYAASGIRTVILSPKDGDKQISDLASRLWLKDDTNCLLKQAYDHGIRLLDSNLEIFRTMAALCGGKGRQMPRK